MSARGPLIVVNPNAARLRDARQRKDLVRRVLAATAVRDGAPADVVDGDRASTQAALADAADRPLVVALGGDGTVREAAGAVESAGVPLAVVPAGTGNVLAAALGFGSQAAALRVLRDGVARRIDLGVARVGEGPAAVERHFLVAAGTGFDARIMSVASDEWKRRLRFSAYVAAALHQAARLRAARFTIEADGSAIELDGLLVMIANCGDPIPGRVRTRHVLDPSDGRLDLIVVGGRHLFDGLRGAVDLLWRTGELEGGVIRRPVEHVRVTSVPLEPIQVDGDPSPPGTLEAWVRPRALTVLAPPV